MEVFRDVMKGPVSPAASQPATSGALSVCFVLQNQGEHVPLTDVRHHPGDAGHDDLRPPGHPACWQHDEGSTVAVSEVGAVGTGGG